MQSTPATTTLLSMFQTPIASAELGANPFATQLGGKTGAPDGQFADVLGLVSNMEIADSQDVMGRDALKGDMAQVLDSKTKALQAQMNASEISQLANMSGALSGENIGRQALPGEMTLGAEAPKDMKVTAGDRNAQNSEQVLLAGFQSPMAAKAEMQPDGDAVAQWAHALARGDIKEVTLQQGGDGVGPRETKQAADASAVEKSLMSSKLEPQAQVEGATKSAVPAAAASTGFVKAQPDQVATPKAQAFSVDGLQAQPQSKPQTQSESNSGQSSGGKSQGKPTIQKGSDFVLSKSVDHQVSNADFRSSFGAMASGYTTHAAVVKSPDLGQPGDHRVQPQTVQFVADKVNELKANGGGRLHVKMNPGNLGDIEINVGMRAGQVHVEVKATNPETLKMLQTSKSDLVGKLANISNPIVDISGKHDMTLKAEHRAEMVKPFSSESFVTARRAEAPVSMPQESKISSSDFVKHSVDASASGESTIAMGSRESSSNSSSFDHGQPQPQQQGFNRGSFDSSGEQSSGRENAFDKWEQSFKGRKSA